MIENRKNFYTLICMEFGIFGGLIIHAEVNVGSVIEAHEYVLAHLYDHPTASWCLKPYITNDKEIRW